MQSNPFIDEEAEEDEDEDEEEDDEDDNDEEGDSDDGGSENDGDDDGSDAELYNDKKKAKHSSSKKGTLSIKSKNAENVESDDGEMHSGDSEESLHLCLEGDDVDDSESKSALVYSAYWLVAVHLVITFCLYVTANNARFQRYL